MTNWQFVKHQICYTLPGSGKLGFGFSFFSDFGVRLKKDSILFCFVARGVELIF